MFRLTVEFEGGHLQEIAKVYSNITKIGRYFNDLILGFGRHCCTLFVCGVKGKERTSPMSRHKQEHHLEPLAPVHNLILLLFPTNTALHLQKHGVPKILIPFSMKHSKPHLQTLRASFAHA